MCRTVASLSAASPPAAEEVTEEAAEEAAEEEEEVATASEFDHCHTVEFISDFIND